MQEQCFLLESVTPFGVDFELFYFADLLHAENIFIIRYRKENIFFFADICSTLIEYWFICIYISTALFRRFDRGLVRWPPFNMRERDWERERERERERESSISLRAQKSFTFYLIWWIFPEEWPVCRQNGEMFTISEFTWHSRRLNYCVSLTMIRFLRCMYTH